MKIDASTGIAQRCFVGGDGFRRCNFIVRNGLARWTKSGKWWTFPSRAFAAWKKNEVTPEVLQIKTATTSEKQ